jgi:hypothetical protein
MSEPPVRPVAVPPASAGPHAGPGQPGLSRGLVRLMAVTCAVTVANLYYAQPLLHSIGN